MESKYFLSFSPEFVGTYIQKEYIHTYSYYKAASGILGTASKGE